MKNRVLTIAAAAAVGVLALTACAGSPASTPSAGGTTGGAGDPASLETTISILAPSYADSSESDWNKIITEFKKTYPKVTVKLQIEGWDGFSEKVSARIQAGDYPDILNDNAFAGSADAKLLYPITDVMNQKTVASIEPSLLANGKGADGTQWAAPDIASARMLIYNTDLFAKAGIAAPPKTWAEMQEASKKLVALGDGVVGYGMPLGKEEAQVESSLWLWGAGGTWVKGEKLSADSPEAVEAFGEMKALHAAGLTQPKLEDNRQDVANLMHAGKLGMIVGHSQIVADAEAKGVKVALAPVPDKAGGKGVATGVTDFVVAFNNKDAKRKQATGAFLDLMYSDAMYEGWYKGTKLLPVTTSMIAKAKSSAKTENDKGFLEALSIVKFLPVGNTHWDALQTALQGSAYKVGTEDPATLLKQIQAQVDAQG